MKKSSVGIIGIAAISIGSLMAGTTHAEVKPSQLQKKAAVHQKQSKIKQGMMAKSVKKAAIKNHNKKIEPKLPTKAKQILLKGKTNQKEKSDKRSSAWESFGCFEPYFGL